MESCDQVIILLKRFSSLCIIYIKNRYKMKNLYIFVILLYIIEYEVFFTNFFTYIVKLKNIFYINKVINCFIK